MARNAETNEKMRDARREQIISSALMLFAKKGLKATRISDIASVSGISQGLMYHYFKSKEEIFVELIGNAFKNLSSAALWLESLEISPKEKIEMAIEKLLETVDESEDFVTTCLLIANANVSEAIPEEAKDVIESEYRTPYEVIARIMAEGQKDGSIKDFDPKELALVFWTSINGLAIFKAVHSDEFKKPDPKILMSMFLK